jgi:hypothetical protein
VPVLKKKSLYPTFISVHYFPSEVFFRKGLTFLFSKAKPNPLASTSASLKRSPEPFNQKYTAHHPFNQKPKRPKKFLIDLF